MANIDEGLVHTMARIRTRTLKRALLHPELLSNTVTDTIREIIRRREDMAQS